MSKSGASSPLSSSSEFEKKSSNLIIKIEIACALFISIALFTTLFWHSVVPAMGIHALAKLGVIFVFPTTTQVARGFFALVGGVVVTGGVTGVYYGIRFSLDRLRNIIDYLNDKYDEYHENEGPGLSNRLSTFFNTSKQSIITHLPSIPVTWQWRPGNEPTPVSEPNRDQSLAPGSPRKA